MSHIKISLVSMFTLCMICAQAANFNIINKCSYTVWPGTFLVESSSSFDGFQLNSNQTRSLDIEVGTLGQIWGRTGCEFDTSDRGSCQTGDCGGGLKCNGFGKPPNTLAQFALNDQNDGFSFQISLNDGFNIPIQFASTSNECKKVRTCLEPSCPDANKKDSCPEDTNYIIVFCP